MLSQDPRAHGQTQSTRAWAPLRSTAFASLFAGYAVSALGNGMSAVAISWLAIHLAHGHETGLLVGAAVAAFTLPGVLAALVAGRVLRRLDPRLLVLAEALLRAAALGAIAGLALAGSLSPVVYVVLLGVSSLFGVLGLAGDLAATAELLPPEMHMAANSLNTVASFAAMIAGPAAAGGIIAAAGPGVVLAVDAGSYALLVIAVVASRRFQPPPPSTDMEVTGIGSGLRALRRLPAVAAITLLCVVFFGLYGPVEVALPVYVSSVLHAGAGVLGGYWAVFSIGATLGALGATSVQRVGLWRVAVAVMAAWGACLVPFGFVTSVVVGFIALGVGGLVYGPFLPLKRTIIQRAAPPAALARVGAASGIFTVTASPVGTALGGPLVAALGASLTLTISGIATIAAALAAAGLLWHYRRHRGGAIGKPATVRS